MEFFERSSFEFLLPGMKKQKNKLTLKNGFTLVELLIVIAIIGILAGVVMVSSSGSVEKGKRASALTTMSSMLPELVTCQDDGGFAKGSAAIAAGNFACCTTNACTASFAGHTTATWPDIITKTGYNYSGTPTGTLATGNYIFFASKTGQTMKIICDYALNTCCDDNAAGTKTNCQ